MVAKSSPDKRLFSLEVGRGVAALLVVLFHYEFYASEYLGSASLGKLFQGGHAGVEYFFTLSGFIIYYVHRRDIGQLGTLPQFFAKRFIRIVPMYWIVISLSCVVFAAHPVWGARKGLDLYNIVADYLLLPRTGQLILEPAWTLSAKLYST